MDLSIGEIVQAVKGRLLRGDPSARARGVSTDSRTVKAGEVFFALKGKRFDGHDFVPQAFASGAVAAVVQKETPAPPGSTLIEVQDTLKALGDLASFWRSSIKAKVVGITGSCGKTTTREMATAVLKHLGWRVVSSPRNYNNLIGLPLSILLATPEDEVLVLEMGMSAPGEIRRLSQIASPDIGMLTNIGPVHLEGFPSGIEGVKEAKAEILEGMREGSLFIYNADDPLVREVSLRFGGEKIGFGKAPDSLVRLCQAKEKGEKMDLEVQTPKGVLRVELNLLGKGALYCALGAIATLIGLGIDLEGIRGGLQSFKAVQGRMCVKSLKGIWVIDDTYNSNPLALKAALEVLSKKAGRRIAVLGDMAELGPWAEQYHREIGRLCGALGLDGLFLLGKWAEVLASEASINGLKGKVVLARDHEELARELKGFLREGDWVLVKGSRTMQMEKVIAYLEGD